MKPVKRQDRGQASPGQAARKPEADHPDTASTRTAATAQGTAGEDRVDLSRADSKAVRRRSVQLLRVLLRPVRLRFALTVALVVLSQAAKVSGPLLIAFGIDSALPALSGGGRDWFPLALTGGGYVLAAFAAAWLTAAYLTATARLSQAMLLDLRLRVFRHTQRLSMEFHEKYTSGRIISRQTSDLEALRELLDSGISSLASGLVFMLLTAVSIFTLDLPTGLLLVVSVLPMLALARWYQRRSQAAYRSSRVVSAGLIVHFVETMTGIRAVKAFRREQVNAAHYDELAEEYRRVAVRSINLNGVFQPGLVLIGNVTVAAVLLLGGYRVLGGALEVGALLALLLATKRFFSPVSQMAMFYNSFQSAQAALEKVSGLLEEVPTVRPPRHPVPLPAARGDIRFSGATFGYGDSPAVLSGLDLHIPAGQTVAVVGATGAGKSTLAKLMARFYDVSEGSLTLDGVELRELSTADLRRAVVMVTQEAFLFSGTVAENIALGRPSASRAEIEAAARDVGADDFIRALPDGYDTDVNKRGGRVSAGQRQLISFARAFLANPAVLILDEATSSLDIPSERLVQQGLHRLLGAKEGHSSRTAVVIAHRLSTVAIADRVLVVQEGRIVEDGTPAELLAGGGRFAELHGAWQDSLL
ncbi:ABC transporter ATP-binding protein [Specibacter sp. NPDC057265]|uniref:ABC transporter ATP-binding protein n=1 Tax=Specibacter sp. NPDC057265 TaxID=3346075 RepID=UPI00364081B1